MTAVPLFGFADFETRIWLALDEDLIACWAAAFASHLDVVTLWINCQIKYFKLSHNCSPMKINSELNH